jgi:hypothetical protein
MLLGVSVTTYPTKNTTSAIESENDREEKSVN